MIENVNSIAMPVATKKKSNTGKTTMGALGLASGAYVASEVLSQNSRSNLYSKALSGLNWAKYSSRVYNNTMLNNKSAAKNFIHNSMKVARNINIAKACLAVVGLFSAGLGIGAAIDGAINSHKFKKAEKTQNMHA